MVRSSSCSRRGPTSSSPTTPPELERTDDKVNDVWVMQGFLRVECDAAEGPALFGDVSFEGCAD